MRLFHEALGSGETTDAFQVNNPCSVQITCLGTFNSVGITMDVSPDRSNWTDYSPDGTAIEFSATGEQRLLVMQPGYYRFAGESGLTDVDVYVDGRMVSF